MRMKWQFFKTFCHQNFKNDKNPLNKKKKKKYTIKHDDFYINITSNS